MVEVQFLGPINKPSIQLEVSSIHQLKEILSKDESLSEWLENSAVAVNDVIIKDLSHPLKEGDSVCLLPPVCGG